VTRLHRRTKDARESIRFAEKCHMRYVPSRAPILTFGGKSCQLDGQPVSGMMSR